MYRLEILHPPWPLQEAAADIGVNTMVLRFARRQDMVAWPLMRA